VRAEAREPASEQFPEPERREPTLEDPGLRDLTRSDWVAIFKRAVRETIDDQMTMIASAVAYSSFFAIPSILLLAVGAFSLVASPDMIRELIDRFSTFMPTEAAELIGGTLSRLEQQPSAGLLMTVVGLILAIWASTSAMTTYMSALNLAYDRKDGRGFVRTRLLALVMVAAIGSAVLLVALFLIFGPYIQRFLGETLGIERAFSGCGGPRSGRSSSSAFSSPSPSSTTSARMSSTRAGS
jgi:membrane protein